MDISSAVPGRGQQPRIAKPKRLSNSDLAELFRDKMRGALEKRDGGPGFFDRMAEHLCSDDPDVSLRAYSLVLPHMYPKLSNVTVEGDSGLATRFTLVVQRPEAGPQPAVLEGAAETVAEEPDPLG